MNLFALSGLLLCISNLGFGVFVFSKNRKSKINQLWAIFVTAVAIWGFGGYKVGLAADAANALFWWQITFVGVIFIPILFWHFVYVFLDIKRKKIIVSAYLVGLFFLVANFTDLLIGETRLAFGSLHWITSGPLFPLFTVFWFGSVIYAHYELFKALKKLSDIRKEQIRYFFSATAFGYMGGGLSFLPVFGIDLYPISNFAVFVYPIIMSYAILRYRLMDIRLAMVRVAIYILSSLSVVGVGYLLFSFNNSLSSPVSFRIFFPVILIISALCFRWFFKLFERIASKFFYYTFYSYQAVLADLGRQLTQILDLKKLSTLIVETLQSTMKLDRTVILFRDQSGRYAILKNVGFKEENGISLVKDNFLTKFLQKSKSPLVFDELSLLKRDAREQKEREDISRIQKNMERIEANVCLPLFRGKDIMGIIVLGRKISGDAYSKEDLELLNVLAAQASIALENARLYEQVQDMSQHLQEKVDEQTKELTIAYKELKRTDESKSEFLSMSSHQLRTPLTVIKGYLSMTLEGDYGKVPPKIKHVLGNVFEASQRLVKIVADLLDVSRIDLGKMKLEKASVQIDDLLQSCYVEMELKAEGKGLRFSYNKPKSRLPKLEIDESKIRQVILNLLDNAIRYTAKGRVAVSAEKKNNHILIKVEDTGVGLTKSEQRDIFEGFTRGSAGINYFTEGAGLGLYVSRKYLDLHKGKIWAESPGKDKGSTFFVELPVN